MALTTGVLAWCTDPWRALRLITDGQVDKSWTQIGWGGFVVDGEAGLGKPQWQECES